MNQQTKQCQNCKKDFTIEADDFSFYEKIKVPPPTFCPWCRLIRRFAWRNERSLYRRICNLCNKNIIAMYHESVPFPVYCRDCWYGDGWDPTAYARPYDTSRNFFEQYKEFSQNVPRLALFQRNSINSDYSNMVAESKNVYLSISVVLGSENIFYSKAIDKSSDIVDSINIKESQSLYENVEGEKNYNCQYLLLSRNCLDSYFLIDCVNCTNCVLSYNLRNKEYYIRNQKYSKEEYFKELEKLNLKSRASRQVLLQEFEKMREKALYRFANNLRSVNSTGNNLVNVKNCQNCFDVSNAENLKYCYRALESFKDSMDVSFAMKSELFYEYITGGFTSSNVKFSCAMLNSGRDADYIEFCTDSKNVFGCISLKNKENAIFNKIYSKEEFQKLRSHIIEELSVHPFVDAKGRIYKYGEFFPVEISPWAYNETLAQEIEPLTKEQALAKGYTWREPDARNFQITIPADKIPDTMDTVDESIQKEVLGCAHAGECAHQCITAFRVTDYEFKFYKKHGIPLPILCPNCRYYERLKVMPEIKLYKRTCMCGSASSPSTMTNHFHGSEKCELVFETAYSPDPRYAEGSGEARRPEIVYCEKCYQAEVY